MGTAAVRTFLRVGAGRVMVVVGAVEASSFASARGQEMSNSLAFKALSKRWRTKLVAAVMCEVDVEAVFFQFRALAFVAEVDFDVRGRFSVRRSSETFGR